MASLLVRQLNPIVKSRLQSLAKARGTSMEAEARAILTAALSPAEPRGEFATWFEGLFDDLDGVKLDLSDRIGPRQGSGRW
jgi:antitoxin FitA